VVRSLLCGGGFRLGVLAGGGSGLWGPGGAVWAVGVGGGGRVSRRRVCMGWCWGGAGGLGGWGRGLAGGRGVGVVVGIGVWGGARRVGGGGGWFGRWVRGALRVGC